jgi:hypothetical protein
MTAPLTLSAALPLAIGFLLVTVFDPLGDNGPPWAAWLFRLSLGAVVGIGFSAIVYFSLLTAGLVKPWAVWTIELAVTGILAALWARRRSGPAGVAVSNPAPEAPGAGAMAVPWILAGVFACALLLLGSRLVQICTANPAGDWDASEIWNLRAKFLTDQQNWRFAVRPELGTRPEYPLLLSSFIARGWKLNGAYPTIVPVLLGLTFWTALFGLLVGGLAIVRGATAGALAGLILLSTSPLLSWAAAQGADIPLACYFLATLTLLLIDARCEARQPWALVWAGACAGLAAGTKNEGEVFVAIVAIAFLVTKPPWRRAGLLLAGIVPALAPTIGMKVFLPAPSVLMAGQTVSAILAKIADPARYKLIADAAFERLMDMGLVGFGPGHPLVLMALLAVLVRPSRDPRYRPAAWICAAAAVGMVLSYFGVYVITPLDLAWHLFYSSERLLLQIWPCFLLLFCRLLPDDAGFCLTVAGDGSPS